MNSVLLRQPWVPNARLRMALIAPGGLLLAAAMVWVLSALVGLESALMALLGLASFTTFTAIALWAPSAAVAIAFILGGVLGNELLVLLPESLRNLSVGNVNLRYSDLSFLTIGVALVVRAFLHRGAPQKVVAGPLWLLFALFAWLGVGVMRGANEYGIVNAAGEMRTYYQYLLLVPYVALSVRSEAHLWRLFQVFVSLALAVILTSVVRGGLVSSFELFGSGSSDVGRWLTAAGGMALLTGTVGVVIAQRYAALRIRGGWLLILLVVYGAIILTNPHRSVWLATGVALATLVAAKAIPVHRQVAVLAAITLGTGGLAAAFPTAFTSFTALLGSRAAAFVNPGADPTSSWRLHLWGQALDAVKVAPLTGVGFGRHFQLFDQAGNLVTTSPHSTYVTLLFHAGVVGAVLYAGFVVACLAALMLFARRSSASSVRITVTVTAIVALSSSAAFFVTYSMEYAYLPWAFIGLGLGAGRIRQQAKP